MASTIWLFYLLYIKCLNAKCFIAKRFIAKWFIARCLNASVWPLSVWTQVFERKCLIAKCLNTKFLSTPSIHKLWYSINLFSQGFPVEGIRLWVFQSRANATCRPAPIENEREKNLWEISERETPLKILVEVFDQSEFLQFSANLGNLSTFYFKRFNQ